MPDVQFLSQEWLAALDEAARARTPVDDDALAGIRLSIEQRVVDGPRWRFVIDDGRIHVDADPDEGSDVRLTSDRATASAIAAGRRAALDAFISGDLTLGGDVGVLLEHRSALEAIGDLFAGVRDATEFS